MKPVRSRELNEGELLSGRYRVLHPHSEGGMGRIYEGIQIGLERKVAIKTLQPGADPDWLARFRREADVSKRLTHPNTVRIYDVGESNDGVPFIAMEFLEGRTLNRVVRKGPLPIEMVEEIAGQVLGGLMEAHAAGIVHRDIKPSNLMLCKQIGRPNFVKVLDFGIAHLADPKSGFETQAGLVVGTPQYMSPEQARGETPDERSDIYSLGITLFELATGYQPYSKGAPLEIAMQHLLPDPLDIPAELRAVPLGRVIKKATEKVVENRYQSASEMLMAVTGQQAADYALFADSNPPSRPDNQMRRTAAELDEAATLAEPGLLEHPPTTVEPPNTLGPGPGESGSFAQAAPEHQRGLRIGTLTVLVGVCVLIAIAISAVVGGDGAVPEDRESETGGAGHGASDARSGPDEASGDVLDVLVASDAPSEASVPVAPAGDLGTESSLEPDSTGASADHEQRRLDRSRAHSERHTQPPESAGESQAIGLEPSLPENNREESRQEDAGQEDHEPRGMPINF